MVHLVNEIAWPQGEDTVPMVVEIPAGTSQKWTTDPDRGELYWETEAGAPRWIRFCPYPFNYGFVPQTWCDPAQGGDGDPLDILLLDEAQPRGTVVEVRVIGGLLVTDCGEQDIKLISVLPGGVLGEFTSLEALNTFRPGILDFLTQWFHTYKGPGLTQVTGHMAPQAARETLLKTHEFWKNRP